MYCTTKISTIFIFISNLMHLPFNTHIYFIKFCSSWIKLIALTKCNRFYGPKIHKWVCEPEIYEQVILVGNIDLSNLAILLSRNQCIKTIQLEMDGHTSLNKIDWLGKLVFFLKQFKNRQFLVKSFRRVFFFLIYIRIGGIFFYQRYCFIAKMTIDWLFKRGKIHEFCFLFTFNK